eukprot:scaffold185958_cov24-Tisochrysis_lutea.AAC.2
MRAMRCVRLRAGLLRLRLSQRYGAVARRRRRAARAKTKRHVDRRAASNTDPIPEGVTRDPPNGS